MSRFALLGALALVSAMAATKATAQEVIYNPGYCAQFYPNANCQNKGPNNPYTGDYQLRNELRGAFARSGNPCALGAESFRITDPGEVASSIQEGIARVEAGAVVLLEFITAPLRHRIAAAAVFAG